MVNQGTVLAFQLVWRLSEFAFFVRLTSVAAFFILRRKKKKEFLAGVREKFMTFISTAEKKEMKKILIIVSVCLVAVLFISLLSSCGTKQKFVGTWDEIDENGEVLYNGETLVLANDGTGSAEKDGMTASVNWSVKGNKLFLTMSVCGTTETYEVTYKFSKDTMTLTYDDGETVTYRKRSSN